MKRLTKYLALASLAMVLSFAAIACSDDDDGGDGDATGGNPTASTGSDTAGTGATGTGGGAAGSESLDGASFSVGSKEFTEQLILGQMTIQILENAGASVEDNTGIVGSDNVRAALTSDEIDMYWEYTGTGWSSHLGREIGEVPDSPEALAEEVAEVDAAENDVIWYATAPMNNTYALVTLESRASELGITTISDYAELVNSDPAAGSLCGATEWLTRDDGLPGLETAYSFDIPDDQVAEVEFALINSLVPAGEECNFGETFATEGTIASNNLVVLEDDLGFFVPYNAALTVRADIDEQYGEALAALFDPLSEILTNETMQTLNARVDVDGEEPATVAEEFLKENGLIQ